MGCCGSAMDAVKDIEELKQDVAELRKALEGAKDALLAASQEINNKVAQVKELEDKAAAELESLKTSLHGKIDEVQHTAQSITSMAP